MHWHLLPTLLLVALSNAEQSETVTEESRVTVVKESGGQGQGNATTESLFTQELSISSRQQGDTGNDRVLLMHDIHNGNNDEVFISNRREVVNNTRYEIIKKQSDEVVGNTSDVAGNFTTIKINDHAIGNSSGILRNNDTDSGGSISVANQSNGDGEHFYNASDDSPVFDIHEVKYMMDELGQYNITYNEKTASNNGTAIKSILATQDEAVDDGVEIKISVKDNKDINTKENKGGVTKKENINSVTEAANKFSETDNKNVTIKPILKDLLKNLTLATSTQSPNSPSVLAALQSLGVSFNNITLPNYTPFYDDIVSNKDFTLGLFPPRPTSLGHGVSMGTTWKKWDVGVPRGILIAVDDPLEVAGTLDQVVGIVVDGITFQRSALLTSAWNSTETFTIFHEMNYLEHRRTVDVFIYGVEGVEEGVQVFWEPVSAAWNTVRCETWVPGQGWDSGLCEATMFGSGLVGCRCRGVTFVEGEVGRARFLVVEESETKDRLENEKTFERALVYLHEHGVDNNGLKDIAKVVSEFLNLKEDMFYKPNEETSVVLLDVGSELHKTNPTSNNGVVLNIGTKAALVVAEGDGVTPLVGLYFGKRWPTDNPEDAEFVADSLHPEGSLPETTTDSEVFAVKITGNESLFQKASLLLLKWDRATLHRYFFKVFTFTQRIADVVFSSEDEDVEGNSVEFVFETATKDWITIHCLAWNFNESTWNDNSCTTRAISSRLHSCICPNTLFKDDNLLRTRVLITEESINRQNFSDWDLFTRTSRHLHHLAQQAVPRDQLPNVTALLDTYILRNVRSNNFIFPSRVLDDVSSILHRLELDHNHTAAFSWHNWPRNTAAMFVQSIDNEPLATVAISEELGRIWNSTQNDISDFIAAISLNPVQNGVDRVTLTYVTTTSRIKVEDRIIHRDKRFVDMTWHQKSPPSVSNDVVLHLKPFIETKQPVTVRSKTCRYWDFVRSGWSDNCKIGLDEGMEVCRCTVLTTNQSAVVHARFLIASNWSEQILLDNSVPFFLLLTSELTIQMIIFHTGCALSLFGLVTVFVTALAFKSWRQSLSNKILLHICSALLLQILSVLFYYVVYHPFFFEFFDFLSQHREWTYLSLAMGLVWSYSYLARWCWMLVMSLLQLMRIVTVMGARNVPNLVRKVSIFAWGGPFIVLGYFLSDPWSYLDEFNRRFYFLTYLLPLSVVLVANLAVFAAILARAFACCGWGKMADLERHGANSWLSIWKRLRTVIVLFFTLEMTWLFELFIYFGYYNAFLHVMSFVVTSFHGFGTFVVFVVLDRDAQAGWRAALHSLRSWRKIALLYCAVLAIIAVALGVVVVVAVLLVCLHTLAL